MTLQCLNDECRALWDAPAAALTVCPECGGSAAVAYEREPQRPAPVLTVVPPFKELPMPELVPQPAPEAVTITPTKRAIGVLKVLGAVAGVAAIVQSFLVPGTLAHTVVSFIAGLGSLLGAAG